MRLVLRVCCARPRRVATVCSSSSAPRLFCSPLPAAAHARVALSAEESRHATRALRLGVGDRVELFDGAGGRVEARIAAVERGGADVEATAAPSVVPWAGARWDVAVACSGMSQRADWLVEKCAELGAARFVPLLTEQSDAPRRADLSAESGRWVRLSVAASKQCLRYHALRVEPLTSFADLLPAVKAAPLALVALQGGAPLREVLDAHGGAAVRAGGLLLVGPPGDFSAREKAELAAAGAKPVGLGGLRLRTETAALTLLGACMLY